MRLCSMPSSTALVLRRVWWHALICVCAADSLAQMEARQRIKTRERHDFLCPCRGGQDRAPSPTGCARSVLRTAIPAGPASSPQRSSSRCYMPVPRWGTEGRTPAESGPSRGRPGDRPPGQEAVFLSVSWVLIEGVAGGVPLRQQSIVFMRRRLQGEGRHDPFTLRLH